MSKLKVGDRVAVYGLRPTAAGLSWEGRLVYSRTDRGTVSSITNHDELVVDFDEGTVGEVHPKQCRLLKKKPLRRMFLPKYLLPKIDRQTAHAPFVGVESAGFREDYQYDDCVEFVEVRKPRAGGGE